MRIHTNVSDEVARMIRDRAQQTGMTEAAVMRRAVELFLGVRVVPDDTFTPSHIPPGVVAG